MLEDVGQQLARSIADRDGMWRLRGSLVEAIPVVARRGYNALEEIGCDGVRALAVTAIQTATISEIETYMAAQPGALASLVEELVCLGFLDGQSSVGNGAPDLSYRPTQIGHDVIRQVAIEAMELDRYRMKGDLHEAELLLKASREY